MRPVVTPTRGEHESEAPASRAEPSASHRAPGAAPSETTRESTRAASHESIHEVRVERASKSYGSIPALRSVSTRFSAGSLTVLSGDNGAGKSTLLGLVGTRLRPTSGEVAYVGRSGARLTRSQVRAELGWVSHEALVYGELSGRDNVLLAAELQGISASARAAAYAATAERVALGRFAERPVSTLSRGQRQRVSLARALIHQPSLLLFDEPWTGLDAAGSRLLDRIIGEERARGAVVIVVAHDPTLASRLGGAELRLTRGRLESA